VVLENQSLFNQGQTNIIAYSAYFKVISKPKHINKGKHSQKKNFATLRKMPADNNNPIYRRQLYQLFDVVGSLEQITTDPTGITKVAINNFFNNNSQTAEFATRARADSKFVPSISDFVGDYTATRIREDAKTLSQVTDKLKQYRIRLGEWGIKIKRDGNGAILYEFEDDDYTAPEILIKRTSKEVESKGKNNAEISNKSLFYNILQTRFNPESDQYSPKEGIPLDSDTKQIVELLELTGIIEIYGTEKMAFNSMHGVNWDYLSRVGIFTNKDQYPEFMRKLVEITQ